MHSFLMDFQLEKQKLANISNCSYAQNNFRPQFDLIVRSTLTFDHITHKTLTKDELIKVWTPS